MREYRHGGIMSNKKCVRYRRLSAQGPTRQDAIAVRLAGSSFSPANVSINCRFGATFVAARLVARVTAPSWEHAAVARATRATRGAVAQALHRTARHAGNLHATDSRNTRLDNIVTSTDPAGFSHRIRSIAAITRHKLPFPFCWARLDRTRHGCENTDTRPACQAENDGGRNFFWIDASWIDARGAWRDARGAWRDASMLDVRGAWL